MNVYFFYRPNTESDAAITTFLKLLDDRQRAKVKLVDVDTREGDDLGRLYSIMSYPSVLIASEDGRQVKFWHGRLPLVEDVAFYLT